MQAYKNVLRRTKLDVEDMPTNDKIIAGVAGWSLIGCAVIGFVVVVKKTFRLIAR